MDSILEKVKGLIQKYKYAVIILLAGIALMLLPTERSVQEMSPEKTPCTPEQSSTQSQLEQILSQVKGAGQVRVMLTAREGEKTVYQTNTNSNGSEASQSVTVDTVLVSDSDRNQTGLVHQVCGPVYQGAIILCQGADSPSVRLAIVDAVSKITGLGADQISVLEMK